MSEPSCSRVRVRDGRCDRCSDELYDLNKKQVGEVRERCQCTEVLADEAAHPRVRRLWEGPAAGDERVALVDVLHGGSREGRCKRKIRRCKQHLQGVCESSKAWSAPAQHRGLHQQLHGRQPWTSAAGDGPPRSKSRTRREETTARNDAAFPVATGNLAAGSWAGLDNNRRAPERHRHARRCAAAKHAILQEEQAWNETTPAAGSEKDVGSTEQFSC